MKATIIRFLDMLKRIHRFFLDHPFTPAVPRATDAHTVIVATIAALQAAAQGQLSGGGDSAESVIYRKFLAGKLREALKKIGRVGRSLEAERPGYSEKFKLPKSRSYTVLTAAANTMIEEVTENQALFIEFGVTPEIITAVTALLTAFEAATGNKDQGGNTQVNSTAALELKRREGLIAARELDACVRLYFEDDAAVLAEWKHARHIEKSPVSATTDTPPPAPPTGTEPSTADGTAVA